MRSGIARSHFVACRPKFINEQYFFVRKTGLGKGVLRLSLVVIGISHRWDKVVKTGVWFANVLHIFI